MLVVVFTDRAFRLVVLSDGDDDLVGGAVGPERLEGGGVVGDGETVGDQAVGADPAGAQRFDGGGKGGDSAKGPLR